MRLLPYLTASLIGAAVMFAHPPAASAEGDHELADLHRHGHRPRTTG